MDEQQNNDMMPDEEQRQAPAFLPIVHVLERHALKAILTHPLAFATTLIKLGYDPYPLSTGKKWLIFGPPTLFRTNMFIYIKNIYFSHGLSTIYTGIVAHLAACMTSDLCCTFLIRHLYVKYPDLGGQLEDELQHVRDPHELTTHQRIRVRFRRAILATISHCIASVAVRPFIVVMVRQIAQHIGSETKYASTSIVQPLRLIFAEEGWTGLFSGLIPQMIGGSICIWASGAVDIVMQAGFNYIERKVVNMDDRFDKLVWAGQRYSIGMVCNGLVNALAHPFTVVSTVMAVNGSGLAVDMPPFMPSPQHQFAHWSDVYTHLGSFELFRGRRFNLRYQHGPTAMGTDGKLYAVACNKRFIN